MGPEGAPRYPSGRMLLVTRPQPDADAEVLALRARGVAAVSAPCLCFTAIPAVPVAVHALHSGSADLLVTSPRAAEFLLSPSPLWRILAVAPKTAHILLARGLSPAMTTTRGGGALATLARPGPVVLATSNLGGEEVLRVRPDAVIWPLYRTCCPDALPEDAIAALQAPFDVWFTSPSTIANFDRLAPGALTRAREIFWSGDTTRTALATRIDGPVTHRPRAYG